MKNEKYRIVEQWNSGMVKRRNLKMKEFGNLTTRQSDNPTTNNLNPII